MADLPDGASEYLSQAYAHRKKKRKDESSSDDTAERIAIEQSGQGGSLAGVDGGGAKPESTGQHGIPPSGAAKADPPKPADDPPADSAAERERVLLMALDRDDATEGELQDALQAFLAAARADHAQKERAAQEARERAAGHERQAQADALRLSQAMRESSSEQDQKDRQQRETEEIKRTAEKSWAAYSGATYKGRPKPPRDA